MTVLCLAVRKFVCVNFIVCETENGKSHTPLQVCWAVQDINMEKTMRMNQVKLGKHSLGRAAVCLIQ